MHEKVPEAFKAVQGENKTDLDQAALKLWANQPNHNMQ